MTRHFKKISSEVIHQNPRWAYKHDEVSLPSGHASQYFYGEKIGGVIIVPLLDDGRLLLLSQYRYLQDRLAVEFPRGAIEPGESPTEAAHREFYEETGCTGGEIVNLTTIEPWNTSLRNPLHIFLADGFKKTGDQQLDEDEEAEILYRRVDEFEDMIRRGEIWDGVTLAAWALAREQVLKNLPE